MIRAIGFDLGETLLCYGHPLDWSSLYSQALAAMAEACDVTPDTERLRDAADILRRYNTRLNPRTQEIRSDIILGQILAAWSLEPRRWLEPATEHFFSFFQQSVQPYPDTLPTLQTLREGNAAVGILTDVPYGMPRSFVQRDLDATGLTPLLDVWLTSVDVGRRKPDPAGFLALAERLGVRPQEMLYVGNEEKDILGANAAGMQSVLVDREAARPAWPHMHAIGSLSELPRLLD